MMKHTCLLLALLIALALSTSAGADSWSQINQSIEKEEGWQQIIVDSSFALGESHPVTLADGKAYVQKQYGCYPRLDGSTVMVPMAVEFARQHLGLSEADLGSFVTFSTTHNAYLNLIQSSSGGSSVLVTKNEWMDISRPVDLMLGTEPSDEEIALAESLGVTLVKKPVCYDAFVFITHVSNPVESLTLDEIRAIYRGEITNWQELGGNDAAIEAYQRDQNSGSQTAMENLVMQGETILSSQTVGIYFVGEMSALVSKIGGYSSTENGIGYTYKYYIDELYRDEAVKVLAIDGVYPDDESIRSGDYPLATQYYGVIREGDEEEAGGLFLDWILSEEGQRCVAQAGYIPCHIVDGDRVGE